MFIYEMKDKKVCIIIPVGGNFYKLKMCLQSVFNLEYQNKEVIVIDDGLAEEEKRMLSNFGDRMYILHSDKRGPSFARNLALKYTDAEFVAFTDSDCIVDKLWLTELMKGLLSMSDAVACGGSQLIPPDASEFEKKVFYFMKNLGLVIDYIKDEKTEGVIEVNHNPTCNVLFKRDILIKEGGFLEGLWPGEDVELDYRLKRKGYKLLFNPKAVVYHYRPNCMSNFVRTMYRYGKAQGFLVKRYGFFRKIHMVALICFFLLLGLIYVSLRYSTFIPILLLISILGIGYFIIPLYVVAALYWNIGFVVGLFIRLNSRRKGIRR